MEFQFRLQITVNASLYIQKGLVFIQLVIHMINFDIFKEGIIRQHRLVQVDEAVLIKSKRTNSVKLIILLSFCSELPEFIDILGELTSTKVYEYNKKPINHIH